MGSISIKCEPAVVSEAIAEVCWRMSSHIRIADNAQKKKKRAQKKSIVLTLLQKQLDCTCLETYPWLLLYVLLQLRDYFHMLIIHFFHNSNTFCLVSI